MSSAQEYEKAHVYAASKYNEVWSNAPDRPHGKQNELWSQIVKETRQKFRGVNWATGKGDRGRWALCPVRKMSLRGMQKHLKQPVVDGVPRHLSPPARPGVTAKLPVEVSAAVHATSAVLQVTGQTGGTRVRDVKGQIAAALSGTPYERQVDSITKLRHTYRVIH